MPVIRTVYVSTASSSRCPTNYQTQISREIQGGLVGFAYAVAGAWRNDVGKEEDVIENTLCSQTQRTKPDGRLA